MSFIGFMSFPAGQFISGYEAPQNLEHGDPEQQAAESGNDHAATGNNTLRALPKCKSRQLRRPSSFWISV